MLNRTVLRDQVVDHTNDTVTSLTTDPNDPEGRDYEPHKHWSF